MSNIVQINPQETEAFVDYDYSSTDITIGNSVKRDELFDEVGLGASNRGESTPEERLRPNRARTGDQTSPLLEDVSPTGRLSSRREQGGRVNGILATRQGLPDSHSSGSPNALNTKPNGKKQ